MSYKSLFLDRDGVINQRLVGGYVRNWEEWTFLDGALEALVILARKFSPLVVVTNQQGVAKGWMTAEELAILHQQMIAAVEQAGGRIDAVYACMEHERDNPPCRKPNPGMARQAQAAFPTLELERSIMVGDSVSDLVFGQQLHMRTALITTKADLDQEAYAAIKAHIWGEFPSLYAFSQAIV